MGYFWNNQNVLFTLTEEDLENLIKTLILKHNIQDPIQQKRNEINNQIDGLKHDLNSVEGKFNRVEEEYMKMKEENKKWEIAYKLMHDNFETMKRKYNDQSAKCLKLKNDCVTLSKTSLMIEENQDKKISQLQVQRNIIFVIFMCYTLLSSLLLNHDDVECPKAPECSPCLLSLGCWS